MAAYFRHDRFGPIEHARWRAEWAAVLMSASDPKRKSHSRDRGALEEWRNQESFYNAAWRMKPSELSNWVDAYITVQDGGGIDADHPHWWAIERFFELMPEHPDECWQAILAILDREPSEAVLGILGGRPVRRPDSPAWRYVH